LIHVIAVGPRETLAKRRFCSLRIGKAKLEDSGLAGLEAERAVESPGGVTRIVPVDGAISYRVSR